MGGFGWAEGQSAWSPALGKAWGLSLLQSCRRRPCSLSSPQLCCLLSECSEPLSSLLKQKHHLIPFGFLHSSEWLRPVWGGFSISLGGFLWSDFAKLMGEMGR